MTLCQTCNAGTYSFNGIGNCRVCPVGTTSLNGAVNCSTCPLNSIASTVGSPTCSNCDVGYYSDTSRTRCLECNSKPATSSAIYVFSNTEICSFTCLPGFILPQCLTPFNDLVRKMGGTSFFALFVLCGFLILACPFLYLWIKRQQKKRDHVISDLESTGHMVSSDFNYFTLDKSDALYSLHQIDDIYREIAVLEEKELPDHLYRLYFMGSNNSELPIQLGENVESIVSSIFFLEMIKKFSGNFKHEFIIYFRRLPILRTVGILGK